MTFQEETGDDVRRVVPATSHAYWLYEYQKLVADLNYYILTGRSETAVAAITNMKRRWREASGLKPS